MPSTAERSIRFGSIVVTPAVKKDEPVRKWVVTDVSPPGLGEHVMHVYALDETGRGRKLYGSATLDDFEITGVEGRVKPRDVLKAIRRGFMHYGVPFRDEYVADIEKGKGKRSRTLASGGKVELITEEMRKQAKI